MKYAFLVLATFLLSVNPAYAWDTVSYTNIADGTPLQYQTANSIGDYVSKLLPYALSFAGLILLAMLIMGGYEIMTAATDAKKADAGKARITTAVIGFVIIFAAYWITQILEIMTGISILK